MRNTKILNIGILILILLSFSTIKVSALSFNDDFENMSYKKRKVLVEKTIVENKKELSDLKEEIKLTKEYLNENESKIIDLQKDYQYQKKITQYGIGDNNDIMLLEIILNSNSVSDFFRNLDIVKDIYIKKNQTLNILNTKENQLLELRDQTINKYEKMIEKKKSKESELKELESIKDEIEELIKKEKEELRKQKEINQNDEITNLNLNEVRSGKLSFNPNNLLQKSNVSVSDMYKALKGTALYELAPIYVEAEQLYGVNALFIAGLTAQESGWGTSNRAIYDNNLTGFGVYNSSSKGINATSKRENILQTTNWLKNKYLTPGASYFYGYGIKDVNVKYCLGSNGLTDYHWSSNITKIAQNLLIKIKK